MAYGNKYGKIVAITRIYYAFTIYVLLFYYEPSLSWVDGITYQKWAQIDIFDLLKTVDLSDLGAVIIMKAKNKLINSTLADIVLFNLVFILSSLTIKKKSDIRQFVYFYFSPLAILYLKYDLKEWFLIALFIVIIFNKSKIYRHIYILMSSLFRFYYSIIYYISFIIKKYLNNYKALISIFLIGLIITVQIIYNDLRLLGMINYALYEKGITYEAQYAYIISAVVGLIGPLSQYTIDDEQLLIFELFLRKVHTTLIIYVVLNYSKFIKFIKLNKDLIPTLLFIIFDTIIRVIVVDVFEMRKAIISTILTILIANKFIRKKFDTNKLIIAIIAENIMGILWTILR